MSLGVKLKPKSKSMKLKGKLNGLVRKFSSWKSGFPLTREALADVLRDHVQSLPADPGPDLAIDAGLDWLLEAQKNSPSKDGGVARHYSVQTGWAASYPETTGYIVPTLLQHSERRIATGLRPVAEKILDWLKSIQLPSGAFHGGHRHTTAYEPVVFDTGQIVLGLAAGVRAFGSAYEEPLRKAADWLVSVQDPDGAWRQPNPFAIPGDHVWETHVAWGLLEAARVTGDAPYAEAAMKNIRWAAQKQLRNGWYPDCGLGRSDASAPLTHTIGYTLRGIVEGFLFSRDASLLAAGIITADSLLQAQRQDGSLPGQLDRDWLGTVNWVCLTGCVQISLCWLLLYKETGSKEYLVAARKANAFVRRTMRMDGPSHCRGGVKGSFPISGNYCRYQYINWACKFMIDACTLESEICG